MTPEGFLKHKDTPVFAAWLEGAEIERSIPPTRWLICSYPAWGEDTEYRIKPPPKTVEMWVNLYSNDGHSIEMYSSKQSADNNAEVSKRIACVPVTMTYTEGEGL